MELQAIDVTILEILVVHDDPDGATFLHQTTSTLIWLTLARSLSPVIKQSAFATSALAR